MSNNSGDQGASSGQVGGIPEGYPDCPACNAGIGQRDVRRGVGSWPAKWIKRKEDFCVGHLIEMVDWFRLKAGRK